MVDAVAVEAATAREATAAGHDRGGHGDAVGEDGGPWRRSARRRGISGTVFVLFRDLGMCDDSSGSGAGRARGSLLGRTLNLSRSILWQTIEVI